MSKIDQFFDTAIADAETDSRSVTALAARELQRDVWRQIRRNFNNPSAAFMAGVKAYDFDTSSVVRLSNPLSSFADDIETTAGKPNLWILLPNGARLGLPRMGKGFGWQDLKRKYGSNLSFAPVDDGTVVLLRDRRSGRIMPIYKIVDRVSSPKKIEFIEAAQKIVERLGLEIEKL